MAGTGLKGSIRELFRLLCSARNDHWVRPVGSAQAVAGAVIGAMLGGDALPAEWRAEAEKRIRNLDEFIKVIDEIISAKSQEEWDLVFHENDLIFGLVQTPDQVIKDACVIENDYIVEYEHFSQGKIKGINCPFQLGKTQSRIKGGAPEFSQNTEEILLGLGYTWEDISGLKDGKVIP